MDIKHWLKAPEPDEKPLDKLVENGGFCGIFRTIGCIGDSLSSGEFELIDQNGKSHYYDRYEYSWGQFLGRMTGSRIYNFSKGGMTAQVYMEQFADEFDLWNPEKACQAYIIALGENDLFAKKQEMGSIKDIDLNDWRKNAHTFVGYYAMIIQRLKEIQPNAKFFLMTMPGEGYNSIRGPHSEALAQMTELFSNAYLLDFRQYAPVYDQAFRDRFYMNGHMNPCGYFLTAQMVASYIDFIIRSNIKDFEKVGLIGTPDEFRI